MILVCGGAGYIGSHAVRQLIDKGEEVIIVDNLETGHEDAIHPKAKFYKVDIRDEKSLNKVFEENKIDEAGEILFNNNPLSAICGVVCPHEDQCLGNCIRGIKDEPVNFYEIESFISREYLKNTKLKQENKLNERIAIIGSGPAGISLALILAKRDTK